MTDEQLHPPQRTQDRRRRWPAPSAANLALWAQAWAQASPFKPEAGAAIQLLRWKRFVQAEEDAFMALVANFTKATGVEVKVINESLDDVQPKASVAANTNQGPDMFWGLYSLPHLFPAKCVDVDRRRRLPRQEVRRLGADGRDLRQGSGGKWIAIPVAYNGNVINYRQSMIEKAGFKEIPKDTAGFLELMKALKDEERAGRLCARPRLGRRQCLGALGAVVAGRATWSTRRTR